MNRSDPSDRRTRLADTPSELMRSATFGYELSTYPNLWHWLSVADMAHVVALAEAGVIERAAARELLLGLLGSHDQPMPPLDPGKGDLYSNRHAWLRERLGDAADMIATGRARREATTIAWHLESRSRLEDAITSLKTLIERLLALAQEHRSSLMPDFTYLQHAHPTTLGHYLLTFAYPLRRDLERLASALQEMNRSPAGAGSVNGSRLPLDREQMARLLEFDGLMVHTRDAMWAPDVAFGVGSPVLSAFVTIDRLVEELQIWSTYEFGFFEPADAHARTSVIMPQKKNPYGLAMLRGRARDALGRFVSIVATNLTPTGQPDNRITAYGEVPGLLNDLATSALLLDEHLQDGEFDVDRMSRAAGRAHTSATEICDWLTLERGVSNGQAHAIVGYAVRLATARSSEFLNIEDLDSAASELGIHSPNIDEATLQSLQDPATILSERRGRGSAADLQFMVGDLESSLETVPGPRFSGFEQRFLTMINEKTDEWNPQ